MTLKEIASLAGVSASTVSRVINHPGSKAASREQDMADHTGAWLHPQY